MGTRQDGIVLSSANLPSGTAFPSTRNARALEVIEQRVLVQKRRATATGGRIMWGNTVINPLRRLMVIGGSIANDPA